MPDLPSIDNLRCFLEAARARNFRRAAHAVALTPTAFGQRIKQLESQLGTPLFERTTRSVTLTEQGLALVPRAERCLVAADDCARVGRGATEHPPMDLTLGTRQELGMSWILPQRRRVMRARPWLNLHLYYGSGPDLLLRVRAVDIDCAVTSTAFSDPKLDSLQLHREDYVLVGSARLLRRLPLRRPEDGLRHTLIDASPDMPLFRYWRDAPGGGDRLRFGRASWLGSIAAIRHQVLEGAGVAVLPEYFVRHEIASGALTRVFPRVRLVHDYFRFVFRAADPRRALFESLAIDMRRVPLA
jgi:LysR family transcriptional regulator, glycine cleavage system transcriptional activator